jgi:hypothetical protein
VLKYSPVSVNFVALKLVMLAKVVAYPAVAILSSNLL